MVQTPDGASRIPELDAIRGFAALGILGLHSWPGWFFWAWSCVDLFFVLSGYLITGILIANANTPRMLSAFYARRILRIWPVYYVTWIAVAALYLIDGWLRNGSWPTLPDGHWLSLIFLQYADHYSAQLPAPDYIWYFAHSWSLAAEEQFYLLWPLLFLLLRPSLRTVLAATVLGAAAAVWYRVEGGYFYLAATRADGLLCGIALAFATSDRGGFFYRIPARMFVWLALAALTCLSPYLLSRGASNLLSHPPLRAAEVAAFSIFYAAILALVIRHAGSPGLALLRHRLLVYFGRVSFAIYMFQVPIGFLGLTAMSYQLINKTQENMLVWIGTLTAAHLSHRFLEQRFLRLKKYFPYRAGGGDAVPSPRPGG